MREKENVIDRITYSIQMFSILFHVTDVLKETGSVSMFCAFIVFVNTRPGCAIEQLWLFWQCLVTFALTQQVVCVFCVCFS